jgi:hypothetical protein
MLISMTPKELAAKLWNPKAAAHPKGKAQRAVRKAARDLWCNAPGGRWQFSRAQVAAIERHLNS